MILRAAIEPTDGHDVRRHVEVVVESFGQGRTEIDKLTPDGWHRRHIVVARA